MDAKQAVHVVILVAFAIQVESNEIKTVYTNGYHYSQYFPLEENMSRERILRFSVRTSRDAHIVLSHSYQADGLVYEIVLGAFNNTMTFIRGRSPFHDEPSAAIRTVRLLDQQEFRYFWIRIKADGRRTFIQVGLSGQDTPFQEWRDPRPLEVQYLSFRSGTEAVWKYGYSDAAYTMGVSDDKRQSMVTSTGYGQYFPLSEVVSHSDESVTLYFTVRTSKEFLILLSPKTSYLGDVYELGINEMGAFLRRRHLGEEEAVYVQQGGFLNAPAKLKFWIQLTIDGQVVMGKGGSVEPIISWTDTDPIYPQFVSFTLHSSINGKPDVISYADVQYGLGPDYTLASQDCRPRWKEVLRQQIPAGTVRGGYDDKVELFICRGVHDANLVSGSIAPDKDGKGICEISWQWNAYQKMDFEVLTGCRFTWVPGYYGEVPKGALEGGDTSDHKSLIYVSRVTFKGQRIVGKLIPAHHLANIVFKHRDLPFIHYEVLVNEASKP